MKIINAGTMNINNIVVLEDFIYDLNIWCLAIIDNTLSGTYNCFYKEEDENIVESWIVHQDYNIKPEDINELIDQEIGVDSASVGYFDFEYALKREENKFYEQSKEKISKVLHDNSSSNKNIKTVDEKAFVTWTEHGDGSYYSYVERNKDNKIIAIKMDLRSNWEE